MTDVSKFYYDVIDDVINGVKDELHDDGVEMQVLDDLKKLWRTKLDESHVFNPEPSTSSAAQYYALLQRPQVQHRLRSVTLIPKVPVPPLNSTYNHSLATVASSGGQLILPQPVAPNATTSGMVNVNTGHIQQTQLRPAVVPAAPANAVNQGNATTVAAVPQLATLPSGLTGHLVQIGQQTYLVPHPSVLSLRPPVLNTAAIATGQQLQTGQFAHLVNSGHTVSTVNPAMSGGGGGITLAAVPASLPSVIVGGESKPMITGGSVAAAPFISAFQKTQVDGGHDSDDEAHRYYSSNTGITTPDSSQPTPLPVNSVGGPFSTASTNDENPRRNNHSGDVHRTHAEDEEDDDDDDDDDFFVPATPGFAPPSVPPISTSVSRHRRTSNNAATPIGGRPMEFSGTTPMSSGPPTPATPLSVGPNRRGSPRRSGRPDTGEHHRFSMTPSKGRKKRRRSSPYGTAAGDSESDDADDYDVDGHYDVGDDVELMTNATMTPAVDLGVESEDDEDISGTPQAPDSVKKPKKRAPLAGAAGRRPSGDLLLSPKSRRGVAVGKDDSGQKRATSATSRKTTSADDGGDVDDLNGELEEEENEEPLNSEDDVSDEEPEVLFESENVIVCQYDKIHRSRNRWRFHLKDGIMAIKGRDHIFQKAVGEADW